MKRLLFVAFAWLLVSQLHLPAASSVVISEFMASNTRTLPGEGTDLFPDWIEIQNVGNSTVNLLDWSLTDNAGNPTKWRFPATNLAVGEFMVIFAGSPERRILGAPLYTGFSLSASGEYLALVDPDGNIASQFAPVFPPQIPDVSYGLAALITNQTVISTNSAIRVRVPTDGSEGIDWTTAAFNDSAWTAGVNGVGFGPANATEANYSATVLPTAPVGFWRFTEASGTTVANLGSGPGMDGTASATATVTTGPRPPQFQGFEANNNARSFNGSSASVGVNNSLLSNRGAFTIGGWVRPTATQAARTGLFGQNDAVEFGFISATTLQCWTPGGGSVDAPVSLPLNAWYHIVAVADGSSIRIFTNGVQAASGGGATANYGSSAFPFNIGGNGVFDATGNFFNGQIDEVVAYHRALSVAEVQSLYAGGLNPASVPVTPYVKTDVSSAMSNVNASAYIRLPFTIDNPTNIALLTLRVRYDDGFAAYINGTLVAGANAPETLAFNSAATDSHSPGAVEEFRIGSGALVAGANVLAIHGLNRSPVDDDFLNVAELIATSIQAESSTPLYFTTPSPGAPNAGGVANPGPAILEAKHAPQAPLDADDLVVTARILPTFFAVSNVVMRYRIMFGAEIEVAMFDDGAHGDGAAGDSVYGATIPASASSDGQMVRWYFSTVDVLGNTSRWPLFANPAESAEYLGTVINPGYVTSKLPIVHFFAPPNILSPGPGGTPQVGADSQGGAKVSVFHDGEFYDNVSMQLRGNSTAGYNKKSHRVEFNREHLFRHSAPGPRLRKTSFVADWPDPTYMRQGLSFWLCDLIGAPAPFYQPVRLELNGKFYQLANHNDLHGEELLQRLGYDPNGALYNAAGRVTQPPQSTGGFEKKTRRWEANTDYANLATAIVETLPLETRGINFMENFDVPNAISYLVAARWVHENDDVWANMSLYHDNDGDNQWRIVPFDLNLSWGAIFAEGSAALYTGVQSTNDNHKSHPLYGSSQTLALSGPGGAYNRVYDTVFRVPQLREMFLRRLRTVMDTVIQAPGTPEGDLIFENEILARRDMLAEEAVRDRAYWGWPGVGGQNNFAPGIGVTNGVNDMINEFIAKRRIHFFEKHSIMNSSASFPVGITKTSNAGIPVPQSPNASLAIQNIEFSPSSGDQDQEYICLTNASPDAIDISGWELDSAVRFTFKQGTVVPSASAIYVTPNVRAFRARTSGPRGGLGLFAVGPYSGQLSARGETVVLSDPTGRIVATNQYVGSPSAAQQSLRITELMYNPSPVIGNPTDAQEFEYVELKNISTGVTLDLSGVRLVNGVEFSFSGSLVTSLAPGARVLVVKNLAAFTARYGGGLPVAGEYAGNLDNRGERIQLLDSANEEILDFSYNNSWYPVTDGLGFSLAVVEENSAPDDWGNRRQWRASGVLNGTPGANDPGAPAIPGVLINEVLSASVLPQVDAIELFNPAGSPADVGGWYVSDDVFTPKKFRIPSGTMIPAGGFVTFTEANFNPGGTGFAFSSNDDEAWLFSGDAGGELTGYAHGFSFGAAEAGVSFGRYITSTTNEHFVAQSAQTLGSANSGPKVGPIVISEIMYHPLDIGANDNSIDEFIELHNITGALVPLYDPAAAANTWKLTEVVDYVFPPNITLGAGKFALVVNFNPADAGLLAAFRAKYNVAPDVQIFGPYGGKLDNSSGRIELKKPGNPLLDVVPYIIADEVDYRDSAPWPSAADGGGPSLQRLNESAYGNDPINWIGVGPSAGLTYVPGGTAPSITVQPAATFGVAGRTATMNVQVAGTAPFFYQWRFNGANIPGANTSQLSLPNLQTRQAGNYSVVVFNSAGSIQSANALLTVLLPPFITQHPISQAVYIKPDSRAANLPNGTNVTFTVAATSGNSAISYQWYFKGTVIPGATSSSYTVADVQLEDEGDYYCAVTDSVDTVESGAAHLAPWLQPVIVVRPVNQTITAGGQFSMSVGVTGNPLPMAYSWRRNIGSIIVATNSGSFRTNCVTLNADDASLNLAEGMLSTNYVMRIVVYNDANDRPGITTTFTLTVQADTDRDGIADVIELAFGLDPNNDSDAAGDMDNDGMSNRAETIAGTNPTNALSYLKIEQNVVPNTATLQFASVTNRTYTIQYTDDLNVSPWQKLADFPALTVDTVHQFADPQWTTNRFYRLVTPCQP